MKKSSSKKSPRRSSNNSRLILILLIIVALLAAAKLFSSLTKVRVLGAQTEPVLLAEKGGDDSGSSGGGSHDSGSGGGSSSPSTPSNSGGDRNSNSGSSNNSGSQNTTSTSQPAVPNETQVDCTGPDGRHFTTSFKDCNELNRNWNRTNFSFTPLETTAIKEKPEPRRGEKAKKLEVETASGKTKIKLEGNDTKVEIQTEGNQFSIKAKEANGQEVELKSEDALKKLNEALKEKEVEVEKTPDNNVAINKGGVTAETELPLSIDPSTHELKVTTPAGTKTVTVLPDQAVENILRAKFLTNIESENIATGSGVATVTQKATLTQINNEPTFIIRGINQKRLLGIIPVGFARTVFVSATTGDVVKTEETTLNQILERISF